MMSFLLGMFAGAFVVSAIAGYLASQISLWG